jgi:hypothetical protein
MFDTNLETIESYCFSLFLVNGGFTEWSDWSICTVTCGSGTIQRTRECSNPEPANNGSDCFGLTVEAKECSMPTTCQGILLVVVLGQYVTNFLS